MFRILAVAVLASAVLASARPAKAQSLIEVIAGIKLCKAVADDAKRLKCYDGLLGGQESSTGAQPAAPLVLPTSWSVEESKSPVDDSPQIVATLGSADAKGALLLRCKEHHTDVLFGKELQYLGIEQMKGLVRINEEKALALSWTPSANGQFAFAPSPVEFIRALPDGGKLFVRVFNFQGTPVDGEFSLGDVSVVRAKIAAACRWPTAGPAAARR